MNVKEIVIDPFPQIIRIKLFLQFRRAKCFRNILYQIRNMTVLVNTFDVFPFCHLFSLIVECEFTLL